MHIEPDTDYCVEHAPEIVEPEPANFIQAADPEHHPMLECVRPGRLVYLLRDGVRQRLRDL